MRRSRLWRATVTPLASIIGSGFLVVAPLLGHAVGNFAVFAMAGIVALAYAVGSAVRYNIRHVEKIVESEENGGAEQTILKWMERLAKLMLSLAYVIAIAFYLELLAAFALRLFDASGAVPQKLIASALIVFIGTFGFWRGLRQLESLEKFSVDAKLAIIAGFLVGLAVVNFDELLAGTWALSELDTEWSIDTIRKLLGAFLIVQGFETSRYMGSVYSAEDRVATMRYAQWLAAAIYLAFIGLASVLFGEFGAISETGIITLSRSVAVILPFMLVVGAVMAQFSAAIADTLASGGLVEAATYDRAQHRYVYLFVMLLALGVLWSSHIFSIIAYASRAFAGYYAIQCAMAALHSTRQRREKHAPVRVAVFSALTLLMILTAIFGIPAESSDA